ncbi:(2Fe-2S)-binding protein [Microbulbifer magnicolonia]|uniref:(2Fe-2S)-binding protein n=1 Tax=Microbulbifer magnicolonia TaxID=3109744 RepID=UPI002B416D59|nr:(2Fe-2S)-binding protein [Microbulbifer sp. GG15]
MSYSISVNGEVREFDVDGDTPLLWVLRDVLGLTGTKYGCGIAFCGACTVHVNGAAKRSCVMPVSSIGTAEVRTIEALHETPEGKALQQAWRELDVVQCGYCQPGQLMSAAGLLAENPRPSDKDIDAVMDGNICRCGTYVRIRAGIARASGLISSAGKKAKSGAST